MFIIMHRMNYDKPATNLYFFLVLGINLPW